MLWKNDLRRHHRRYPSELARSVCTLHKGTQTHKFPPSSFAFVVTTAAPHHTITNTAVNTSEVWPDGARTLSKLCAMRQWGLQGPRAQLSAPRTWPT